MAVFAKVVPSNSDVSDSSDAAAMSNASDSKVRISGCMGDFVAVGFANMQIPHPRRSANHSPHVSRIPRITASAASGLFIRDFMK